MTSDALNIALVYDFDGTLAPGNMQEGRFIPAVGLTKEDFWQRWREYTRHYRADPTLAYMQLMLDTARESGVRVTRHDLAASASSVKFFPGVSGWFDRINRHARAKAAHLSHYVVSSGNAETIEATAIAGSLDGIFGSRFAYDDDGAAAWPAEAVNFTTKTQYLFRINKDAVGPDQRDVVNLHIPQEDRPFPFENMVYLGDGETDIPCFSLVEQKGGLSVAIHAPGRRTEAERYLAEGRVHAVAEADYRENTPLDRLIRSFIDHAAARHRFRLTTRSTHTPPPPQAPAQRPGTLI